ncbi:DUF317 domain-containing protein [Streptomyces avermitilis]|uniref:DUF317 domain-containing protein n=1 Tax=Streptomyces avermitilis TaxID=33903 RepID=UPI003404928D
MTDTERQTIQARTTRNTPDTAADAVAPPIESVPAYAADPGDHEALLDDFLTENGDWEKYRTFSDDTTHVIHESQTLRIQLLHEADPRDDACTVAAYVTPVSDRMWHLTLTANTPAGLLNSLLISLAHGEWDTRLDSPITEKSVAQVAHPLTDAGWTPTTQGRWLHWKSAQGDAGLTLDAFAAKDPNASLTSWTIWAGDHPDRPTWAINASTYTPAGLLADLAEELAHGIGTRQTSPQQPAKHISQIRTALPPRTAETSHRR